MPDLEHAVAVMADALSTTPRRDLHSLERAMQRLTREQIAFVRCTIDSATMDGRLSDRDRVRMEYFFESWWKHDLSAKLAVIQRVMELAETTPLPDHLVPSPPTSWVESIGDYRTSHADRLSPGGSVAERVALSHGTRNSSHDLRRATGTRVPETAQRHHSSTPADR